MTWKNGHGPVLLDGHNRLEICQRHGIRFEVQHLELSDRDAAKIWIIENQFGRRNLSAYTRGELALQLEPLYRAQAAARQGTRTDLGRDFPPNSAGSETRDQLSRVASIGHDTLGKVKLIAAEADESTKRKLRTGEISIHRIATCIKENRKKAERSQLRRDAEALADPLHPNLIVGDFREHADQIADGSLALIFSDPPYVGDIEGLLADLAEFAARKLAVGGSLVTYMGQYQLPVAFRVFADHLRYWWTCACVHSGSTSLMNRYGIRVGWKPILWFVKETRQDAQHILFDTVTGGTEKQYHEWQQAESEARHWIDALCPEDGLVCDPFLGSGTTAAAAVKLGRKWIGFEIDPGVAALAGKRIAEAAQ